MPPPAKHSEHISVDTPLTLNSVMKWGGIIFTLLSSVISLVWFAALLKGDIISLQDTTASIKREADLRNDQQDKDIDKLKDRADGTDRAISDLGRKLDVAVTILERIDKKVGGS